MQVRRLKLTGFKSFVEPTELRIEPGLTGIVGPNGCGKSNLLEAIRWVMGETSAKSLRSGGMEDVIFSGTEKRPPRAFAEVVLQGRDREGEELEVARRIERGAGSAYRVNGRDVRAKDVALTFADAATGAHSPALVSQGRIAQVIAAKPAERRAMLEEAAGIAGLHVRRRDAEAKLRQTEANLDRVGELAADLDTRIAGLRRQAKRAEQYERLSREILQAEARLAFARWSAAAAGADRARHEAAEAENEVERARGAVAATTSERGELDAALRIARTALADRGEERSALGTRLTDLAGKLEAAGERLADLERQQNRLEQDRDDADRTTRDAATALETIDADLDRAEAEAASENDGRPALECALEAAEDEANKAQIDLARLAAANAAVEADWQVAEAAMHQTAERVARLEADRVRQHSILAELGDASEAQRTLAEAEGSVADAEARLEEARKRLKQARDVKGKAQQDRDAEAEALSTVQAELSGEERAYELLARDRAGRARNRSGPTALDAIEVASGYERAMAAMLGTGASASIGASDPGDDAWTGGRTDDETVEPVAGSLLRHVVEHPPELRARLARTIVLDRDDGRPLDKGDWLVTREGKLRRWDGFVGRGGGAAQAARLEADNRLSQLIEQLPDLRERAIKAAEQADAASKKLAEATRELTETEGVTTRAAELHRSALLARDRAAGDAERVAARREQAGEAVEELDRQLRSARMEAKKATDKRNALPERETNRKALDAAGARNDEARRRVQAAAAALAARDQAAAVANERLAALRRTRADWRSRSGENVRRLSDMNRRLSELQAERERLATTPEELRRSIVEAQAQQARVEVEHDKARTVVEQADSATRDAERALAEANETLATARETRAGALARAENEEARCSEMVRIAKERFRCAPAELPEKLEFAEDEARDAGAMSEALDRLIARRERIGPVNLVAGDELAALESEASVSIEEKAELAEAVARLRGSIGALNREGRQRLSAAFEAVDGHFRDLFARLFDSGRGGGEAHLALIDDDDPLEAGLEIYAQPPGKRLQSLALLSGGEQALTAIALIFALFLANPAPLCVLDEVDAPLDDANTDRFCDLLDAMARDTATRYLVVTHNAVTMSRMHRLFGVTMTEPGISRLVSVDLGVAEELAAA